MFNIFGSKKNTKVNPLLGDISAIKQAQKDVAVKREESLKEYRKYLLTGLVCFKRYTNSPDTQVETLKKAVEMFTKAIGISKKKAEPFFYLAYISYLSKDFQTATKYLNISKHLNPNLNGLIDLEGKILTEK